MIPATLGHYRIVRSLGAGGMGEVYLADDSKLGRQVALKVLPGSVAADPHRRARFEREARAVAALNHPNIVTIHSVEEHDGVAFLTMELVEGRTLSELIPQQGMTLDALLKVAIPLADAVGAAHQRGITHRDLKPANVMVAADGRVKVLDFGLAKRQDEAELEARTVTGAAHLTGEGRIIGTVAYMSPEQARDQTPSGVIATGAAPAAARPRRRSVPMRAMAAISVVVLASAAAAGWFLMAGRTGGPPPFSSIRLTQLTHTGDAALAAVSSDGRYVVHVVGTADRRLWMRQTSTASNVQIVAPMEGRYDGLTFSPDGEAVLYVFYPKSSNIASLFQIPILGGAARKLVDDIDTPPTFSPDGKQMVCSRPRHGRSGDSHRQRGRHGRLAFRKPPVWYLQTAIAWSPDGRVIAAPVGVGGPRADARIVLVDVKTGTERVLGSRTFDAIGRAAGTSGSRTATAPAGHS